MGLLEKISFKTRKWNLKFNLLDVYIHDGDQCWGFSFCEVIKDYVPYSLLAIEFRLPNGAERTKVQWTNWDILFLSTPLFEWVSDLEESMMWGYEPTKLERTALKLANRLFK
jgi:hypothetical protein